MTAHARSERGFTLVEAMVVVTIISVLSSVAYPLLQRAMLRARAAERATILAAMRTGIEDSYVRSLIPPPPGMAGAPNPPGVAGTTKRIFQNALPGWSQINIQVQGACYYTYEFTASQADTAEALDTYWIAGTGDLDGDGVPNVKQYVLQRTIAWEVALEDPPYGRENDVGNF